jgi:hypothetical protein
MDCCCGWKFMRSDPDPALKSIKKFHLIIQWAPLNGIADNGINCLGGLNLSRKTNPKLLFHTKCTLSSVAY